MSRYNLTHERKRGRCAWCWEPIDDIEGHTVVRATHLELHFHHKCWPAYQRLSGVDRGARGVGDDWPPQRIEALRMFLGMELGVFCKAIRVSRSRLLLQLNGAPGAIGYQSFLLLKGLAARSGFERAPGLDWRDPATVFCLRMHLGMTYWQFARVAGGSEQQPPRWERCGVPARSLRTMARLSALAIQHQFDAGMVVADRAWDHEHLKRAIAESGKSHHEWAQVARVTDSTFWYWADGRRGIGREAAWRLTRAAVLFGAALPPVGIVARARAPGSHPFTPEERDRGRAERSRKAAWTLDQMMLLGTLPDRMLGEQLGKTRMAVMLMRRAIGDLPCVDPRYWDGVPRPQPLARAEMQQRWDRVKERGRQRVAQQRLDYLDEVAGVPAPADGPRGLAR